jgi:hypothetical protein
MAMAPPAIAANGFRKEAFGIKFEGDDGSLGHFVDVC